jgi:hypothetical protein
MNKSGGQNIKQAIEDDNLDIVTAFKAQQQRSNKNIDNDSCSVKTTATLNHHNKDLEKKEQYDDDSSTIFKFHHNHNNNLFKRGWNKVIGDIYANDDPMEYRQSRKNIIILIVALSGVSGPIGSMIYMPGATDMAADLYTSLAGINGTVAAYVVCMGLAVSIYI